ncbi:MAG: nucleotidyltransferase family protein [Bacteroidales bacterium]|nr:nucleotidyltransferase family protein [Bacteroidales bacterium]
MTRKEEIDTLFALVRSSWGLPVNHDFKELSEDEWQSLLRLSCGNNIRAITADGIKKIGLQPPRNVWLPWLAEASKVELQYRQSRAALAELTDFFCQNGIRTIELKGGSLATLYPVPEHREATDLDIYQFGDHRRADALVQQHYAATVHDDGYHHTKYNFKGITVENHYSFLNNLNSQRSRDYEALLHQQVPSATFTAMFVIRHTASHFASSSLVARHLLDWAAVVQSYRTEVDWQLTSRAIAPSGMTPFVATVQALTAQRLGIEPVAQLPISTNEDLNQRVLNDIVYGEFAERHHEREDIGRALWKLRRYHAARWKRQLVGHRPQDTLTDVAFHLRHPRTIIHKS